MVVFKLDGYYLLLYYKMLDIIEFGQDFKSVNIHLEFFTELQQFKKS